MEEIKDREVEEDREGGSTVTTGAATLEETTEEALMVPVMGLDPGVVKETMVMTSTTSTRTTRTRWETWSGSMSGFRQRTMTWGTEAPAAMMEAPGEASTSPGVEEETTSGVEGGCGAAEVEGY